MIGIYNEQNKVNSIPANIEKRFIVNDKTNNFFESFLRVNLNNNHSL